jgi:hypothetical protein
MEENERLPVSLRKSVDLLVEDQGKFRVEIAGKARRALRRFPLAAPTRLQGAPVAEGHVPGHAVKPGAEWPGPIQAASLEGERQEDRLEGVARGVLVADDPAADRRHEGFVAAEDRLEGGLFAALHEGMQKVGVPGIGAEMVLHRSPPGPPLCRNPLHGSRASCGSGRPAAKKSAPAAGYS